jgi:hypothetical protein
METIIKIMRNALLGFALLSIASAYAQTHTKTFECAKHIDDVGSANDHCPHKIKIDAVGNSYIIGRFQDPKAGVSTLTSAGNNDIFVVKYAPFGRVDQLGSAASDVDLSLVLDTRDNTIISGLFDQTVDFDPESKQPHFIFISK